MSKLPAVDVYTKARKGQPCVITRISRVTALHGAATQDEAYQLAIVHKTDARGTVTAVRLIGDVAIDRASWADCRPITGLFDMAAAMKAFPYGSDPWESIDAARAALRPFASAPKCSVPDCPLDADPRCSVVTGDASTQVDTRTMHALCRGRRLVGDIGKRMPAEQAARLILLGHAATGAKLVTMPPAVDWLTCRRSCVEAQVLGFLIRDYVAAEWLIACDALDYAKAVNS